MNTATRLAFCFLLTIFLCAFGCSTSKPAPDPLAGWQLEFNPPDHSIVNDWQDYIQTLPPGEKERAGLGNYFKDEIGQHAIKIRIPLNGTDWEHILIYDKDNKRIKIIKYASGRYSS